ncbi:MAG: hypothetical protein HY341_00455, partial [Candidatus Kerfeldbacteria bacterium]|nr:hypothetical protein [Candidatus Kerfeldbacteria bacterium]
SYPFRIISIDPEQHRLGLSLRPPRTESAEESKMDAPSPSAGETPVVDADPKGNTEAAAPETAPDAERTLPETPSQPTAPEPTDTAPAAPEAGS